MSKPIIPLIILFFSFATTTISVPSQSFLIANGTKMTNRSAFHNSLSGNKSIGALKANAHSPNSISFHNKFQQDLLPRFMAEMDNIHHQNPQSRVILKENDKWRLRVMNDGPSEPDSDGNGHSNNANANVNPENEEDDELTKALKAELAEKFLKELDEIKNEWLRNDVLRKMFEKKSEDYIINAIHLLSSVAVVSGLGIITYEKTLGYIRALTIIEHISMAEYYLSVVEGFIKECQIEKGSKLTPKEVKKCLLSNLHLDLLKDEFLGILGIHEDGNEKNSNNDKPIEIEVKEKFSALNVELEKARPFLRALKPIVKYDIEAKLARERLTKTYNLMYRLKSLLNICDYFQGWKEELMPGND